MALRVLVTDGMDAGAMEQLRKDGYEVIEQFYEPDQLGEALRGFDVAVVRSKTKVRKEHIDAAKGGQLKLVTDHSCVVESISGYCKKQKLQIHIEEPMNGIWELYIENQ